VVCFSRAQRQRAGGQQDDELNLTAFRQLENLADADSALIDAFDQPTL
jgi:hypothetical protein